MDTLFVGQKIIQLNEVASTNTYAINLLKDVKVLEGSVIIADKQSNGRGQRGNLWLAEPSMNLTFSCILFPSFLNASNHFYLSKITALALYDALTEIMKDSQHDIKIKWPNDILVNNKKIAGVLIENNFRAAQVQQAVIGIGLNVNQENFGELKATSLKACCTKTFSLKEVLAIVCKHLETWYLKLRNANGYSVVDGAYLNSLYLLNEWEHYAADGQVFKARISGVDDSGKLVVEMENNSLKKFDVKEIVFP